MQLLHAFTFTPTSVTLNVILFVLSAAFTLCQRQSRKHGALRPNMALAVYAFGIVCGMYGAALTIASISGIMTDPTPWLPRPVYWLQIASALGFAGWYTWKLYCVLPPPRLAWRR